MRLHFTFEIDGSNMWRTICNAVKTLNAFSVFGRFEIAFYGIHLANISTITTFGAIRTYLSFEKLELGEKGKKSSQGT